MPDRKACVFVCEWMGTRLHACVRAEREVGDHGVCGFAR